MRVIYYLILFFRFLCLPLYSQELEPRALSNLPVGTNFLAAGYAFASGNVLMDPSLPLEDLDAKLHTFYAAYVRSINLFGLSAKIDCSIPFATGDWYYKYQGVDEYDLSNGFGDARLRLSVNFIGAPALDMNEFKEYRQKSIVVQVIVPTGNYKSEQLPNLGSNRWTFKNQVGISQIINKWTVEGYFSFYLFTANKNFLNGNKLTQHAIFNIKGHIIRSFPKRIWLSFGAGYGYGGKTYLNKEPREAVISALRIGLILAVPIAGQHSLKLSGISGIRFKQGPDFDAISLTYQYRWVRKK